MDFLVEEVILSLTVAEDAPILNLDFLEIGKEEDRKKKKNSKYGVRQGHCGSSG